MPKLSRRSFLLGAASALAISGILLPMREAKALNSMKIGLGLNGIIYSSTQNPFLNIFKMGVQWGGDFTSYGSASGATTNSAGYAVGATVITVAAAGSGDIQNNDVVSFTGGGGPLYKLTSGCANVAAGGSITIASPGLVSPLAASPVGIVVVHRMGQFYSSPSPFDLDTNGFPKSMTGQGTLATGKTFAGIDVLLLNFSQYTAGNYSLLWDSSSGTYGTGNVSFSGDTNNGNIVSTSTGKIVIGCNSPSSGVRISFAGMDGTTYPINIRFVLTANEADLAAGEQFDPIWLSKISPFKTYRFMDWLNTNANTAVNWSDVSNLVNYVWWTTVPYEVCIALCNKNSADGWFNTPGLANNDFIVQLATLLLNGNASAPTGLKAGLTAPLIAYLELCNEIWNLTASGETGVFIFQSMALPGYAMYPSYKSFDPGTGGTRSFTATIDNGSGTGSPAGTIMTVTAIANGRLASGSPLTVDTSYIFDASGNNLGSVVNQLIGTIGLTGTYTVDTPQAKTSQTITEGNNFSASFQYGLTRQLQNGAIIKQTWTALGGDTSRLKIILAGQNGNLGRNQFLLGAQSTDAGGIFALISGSISGTTLTVTGVSLGTVIENQQLTGTGIPAGVYITSGSGTTWTISADLGSLGTISGGIALSYFTNKARDNTNFFAVAPYWGYWNASIPPSNTLDDFFAFIDGTLEPQTEGWLADSEAVCADPLYGNGITMIYYEGGQQFDGRAGNDALFLAGNTDIRMYDRYITLLNAMQAAGGVMFPAFVDVSNYTTQFYWGAMQYSNQTVSKANTPKMQALLDFQTSGAPIFTGFQVHQ